MYQYTFRLEYNNEAQFTGAPQMATPALVQHLPQPQRSWLGWVRRALGTHRGVCAWQSRGSARSWSLRRLRYPKATRCVFRCWHSVRKYIKPILERGQGRCKVVDTCDMICTSLDSYVMYNTLPKDMHQTCPQTKTQQAQRSVRNLHETTKSTNY